MTPVLYIEIQFNELRDEIENAKNDATATSDEDESIKQRKLLVIDVRNRGEIEESGKIVGSRNIPRKYSNFFFYVNNTAI